MSNDLLEYYLVSGKIRIGKKELAFELLRKDSILRGFLGYRDGGPGSMLFKAGLSEDEDYAVIDFVGRENVKLDRDPAPALNELKQRYGGKIGGSLFFRLVYTTYNVNTNLEGNLDEDNITLKVIGAGR